MSFHPTTDPFARPGAFGDWRGNACGYQLGYPVRHLLRGFADGLENMADEGFQQLESARLVLRRFRAGDLAAFCGYRSNPDIARYQSWETYTPANAERFY